MVRIDKQRVQRAIERAERRTSGEICVSVSPPFWGNVRKVAERAFVRLGMTATRERNAVLFFVVPSRHEFAVLGDRGINERVDPEFWHRIAWHLSDRFQHGDFTGGLVAGIEAAGEELARHFPYREDDTNELSDVVDESGGFPLRPGHRR
jgi:uncharacterized membrane protein